MERVLERWLISRLTDDHMTEEIIEVRIYGDDDGYITNVVLKTQNGLKHFGKKVSEGEEDGI